MYFLSRQNVPEIVCLSDDPKTLVRIAPFSPEEPSDRAFRTALSLRHLIPPDPARKRRGRRNALPSGVLLQSRSMPSAISLWPGQRARLNGRELKTGGGQFSDTMAEIRVPEEEMLYGNK
jgi:hypothetical protein